MPRWLTPLLALLGALGTLLVVSIGVGVWKAGVDTGVENASVARVNAEAALVSATAAKAASDTLVSQVRRLESSVDDLKMSQEALTWATGRLEKAITAQQQLASRSWVLGLKNAADSEHKKLEREAEESKKKRQELEERIRALERKKGRW